MSSAPLSSRRFACDRCRGQKLRCLRQQGDQVRCDRCLKADAQCLTTPTLIIRSPSSDGLHSIARKRQRRDNTRIIHQSTGPYARDVGNGGDILPPNSASTSSALGSNSVPVIAEVPQVWDSATFNPELINDLDGMLSTVDYGSTADTDTQKRPSFESIEVTSSNNLSPIHHLDFPNNYSGLGDTPGQHSTDRIDKEPIEIVLSDFIRNQNPDPPPSVADSAESCTHQLSSINLKLLTQLNRITQGPPLVKIDMLVTKSDESDPSSSTPIDDILNGTREFVDGLELLSRSLRPSAAPSSSSNSPYGSEAAIESPDRGRSGSSDQDFSSTSASSSLPSTDSSSGRKTCNGRSSVLDVATQLLILSCYVHVLRLYVVLFAYIHRFLREIADSDDPTLCPIPDLGFGNFPLQSGNLQATMFIQIATSLFEKIESLLGLPQELRVTVRNGKPDGLLSEGEFTEVVKITLAKDEVGTPQQGKGGVKSLRRNMMESMQLLRESIAP
ncbi:hypothetical protein F5Y04DRAFT_290583 [Hypomontagnella monticulosa]|nr:hypothetical protein F5Y04DRAFT_290583 [Hypomontagnella monticulosa]